MPLFSALGPLGAYLLVVGPWPVSMDDGSGGAYALEHGAHVEAIVLSVGVGMHPIAAMVQGCVEVRLDTSIRNECARGDCLRSVSRRMRSREACAPQTSGTLRSIVLLQRLAGCSRAAGRAPIGFGAEM